MDQEVPRSSRGGGTTLSDVKLPFGIDLKRPAYMSQVPRPIIQRLRETFTTDFENSPDDRHI